jgi:hypothetical protein
MSDPNERPESRQQGDGSAQDDTERRVEATEGAERKARELGVDLASVEGTGSDGRITARDVENAHRQTDTTTGPVETLQGGGSPSSPLDDIHMQYVVLKATLAGPKDRTEFPLKIVREDGVEEIIGRGTFPNSPTNFFAPEPRTRNQPTVTWRFPDPQPPIPKPLPGTVQPCRSEGCRLFEDPGVGRSPLGRPERTP